MKSNDEKLNVITMDYKIIIIIKLKLVFKIFYWNICAALRKWLLK